MGKTEGAVRRRGAGPGQAEKSAETRRRLMEAAVACLHAKGYAAVSTEDVLKAAGVSRGAMLHQFPTRADLMVAVVQGAYREEVAAYARLLSAIADPDERLGAIPEIAWDVLGRPAGVAVLEILQASRSDDELGSRLRPVQEQIEADSLTHITLLEGIVGRPLSADAIRLVVWAVRGLSIAHTLTGDTAATLRSVKLLRQVLIGGPAVEVT